MGFKNDDTCLAKVADDEPIFVLRAKDRFSPFQVRGWVALVEEAHIQGGTMTKQIRAKLDEAVHLAELMEEWQDKNGCKTPD